MACAAENWTVILSHCSRSVQVHCWRANFSRIFNSTIDIWVEKYVCMLSEIIHLFPRCYSDHRPRDHSCWECNRLACPRLRCEWRFATTHPESICSLPSVTTRYSKYLIFFSLCIRLEYSSLLPRAVGYIFRARHPPSPAPGADHLVVCSLCNYMNLEFR